MNRRNVIFTSLDEAYDEAMAEYSAELWAMMEEAIQKLSPHDIEVFVSSYLREIGHGPTESVLPDRNGPRIRPCRVDRRRSGRAP